MSGSIPGSMPQLGCDPADLQLHEGNNVFQAMTGAVKNQGGQNVSFSGRFCMNADGTTRRAFNVTSTPLNPDMVEAMQSAVASAMSGLGSTCVGQVSQAGPTVAVGTLSCEANSATVPLATPTLGDTGSRSIQPSNTVASTPTPTIPTQVPATTSISSYTTGTMVPAQTGDGSINNIAPNAALLAVAAHMVRGFLPR